MHVGLATGFAHQRGDTYDDARFLREEIDNLVLAEELGFDSVWITEHHFSDYSMSNDPVQLLTYVAAKTRHVKLGTQCIIVPWHHPVRLAERIVNLDILSNGRAILGFGGGLSQHEFAGLGIDMSDSRQMYLGNTMRAAIKNYHLDTPGVFPTIKGYEHYEKMVLAPEAIEPYVADFAKGAVTGTPQMILERLWELKEIFKPQGLVPHLYYGGMPQDEARKNMHLFAEKVLPELKSWEAETSIDDRFLEAAE